MPITRRRRANPPDQPENNNNHFADQTNDAAESLAAEHAEHPPTVSGDGDSGNVHHIERPENTSLPPLAPLSPVSNGDRAGLGERPDYTPPIEGGRRTARGELFRRPPQPPPQLPPVMPVTPPTLQAPTHEISLPLGNLLHLAYNPGYTGADEARSVLLHRLENESKAGGRARCWNCGSIAIVYDRWNTRSKTLGEIGIAFCEICGVWSVM